MKFSKSLPLLVLFLLLTLASKAQSPQSAQKIDIKPIESYLLYLPEGYKETSLQLYPLILFLHGSGERGDNLELIKKNGLPKRIAEGDQFPFIVASPQCPAGRRWSADDLNLLLDSLIIKYNVDPERVYLTGLSMGGFGTWDLAIRSPQRFAAIAPVCGGGKVAEVCQVSKIPTWVFHGAKDNVVHPYQSAQMVAALKACGGNVKFTLYPDAKHDSWAATYANPQLYDWFLQHKKPNKWESEFQAFDKQDSMGSVKEETMLFTGSSSIRMWQTLKADLNAKNALNRAFGGSTFEDLIKNIDRVVFRYQPSKIFIYSGDNDLAEGKSVEETFTNYKAVFDGIRKNLPAAEINIIAVKPSPSRARLLPDIKRLNAMIKLHLSGKPSANFIDVYTPMVDKDGQPVKDLFLEDNLHLNKKGYAIWTKVLKPFVK